MAGIAGIIYPDPFQVVSIMDPILNSLSHRGPSEREEITFKNAQFGICGSLLSTKADCIAGLDGCLYNEPELRLKLHTFDNMSSLDRGADLLIRAYRAWGLPFLEQLEGDFAFFIFDKRIEKLILGRDRIGKKPLYWFQGQRLFMFGSELKSLLASGAVPQTPEIDALAAYMYFGYIPQDMSPIQGVNKLLPGYYMQYHMDKSKSILPYWSYSHYFQSASKDSPQSSIIKIDEMLQEATQKRIPSGNGPLGCFLSGGLGSATTAYYLQQQVSSERLNAYSVSFQGENTVDLTASKEVSQTLHLNHSYEVITPQNFLQDLPQIIWHVDEPLADPNIIATWHLAKLAKPIGTVFSGMGSDELLAGHGRYTVEEEQTSYSARMLQILMPTIQKTLLPLLYLINKPAAYRVLQQDHSNPWQLDFLNQNALFKDALYKSASPRLFPFFDPHTFLRKFHHLQRIRSRVASYMYFDIKTRLVDGFILQYDRITAAQDLDWKTPFLSEQLIEYLASLAEPERLHSGETFAILKHLLHGKLSESIVNRQKRTRPQLLQSWIEVSDLAKIFQMLPKGTLVEQGFISEKWLKKQIATPASRAASFKYLWSILTLEIWFRLFINKPIQSNPPQISIRELLES